MVKLSLFNVLYTEGDINLIVDTNVDGVKVPPCLCGKLTNFIVGNKPSPHLEVDENGIIAPMRFGGDRFVCFFPWDSIMGMVSKKAVVNFPPEEEEDRKKEKEKRSSPLKLIK